MVSLSDEHERFIATGYSEERWQQVLESRRRLWLKMNEPLEDIEAREPVVVSDPTVELKKRITSLERQLRELQQRPTGSYKKDKPAF